ncbi:hypothetical protein CIPAW_15G153200 [Carya illinoinensis]|uniref:Uncharacterized protein n=1 Tax=Carya illinoinensis TaxID=32201 RepID=A0A8T1NFA1_CARIL|nr:hypothetical protein CIPAW_15G153200 [Carya illinoinensis]
MLEEYQGSPVIRAHKSTLGYMRLGSEEECQDDVFPLPLCYGGFFYAFEVVGQHLL